MPITEVLIADHLWKRANEKRRKEWQTLIADLLAGDPPFPATAATTLIVDCDDDAVTFLFEGDSDSDDEEGELIVPRTEIAHLLKEYLTVIDQLGDEGLHPMRAEALDMGKRVVHDDGGRTLGALLPSLSPSHDTCRRVFSIVVALAVDTTKRAWAHRHA
jgi:uncharacterized protein (UPF0262 family)